MPVVHGPYCSLRDLIALRVYAQKGRLHQRRAISLARHAGENRSRIRGRGVNFEEVRQYQPGDDVRNIDWRVTARTQKTHTKVFHEEKEKPVFVILDQRLSLFFGSRVCFKSVMAAQLAGLIAWGALDDNERVGGIVFGDQTRKEIRPARNSRTVLKFLRDIDQCHHALSLQGSPSSPAQAALDDALFAAAKSVITGSRIFIISDFSGYTEHTEKCLLQLARHHTVSTCFVYDPLEKQLPTDAAYAVSNGQETLYLSADRRSAHEDYRHLWQARLDRISGFHRKHGLFFEPLATTDDPLQYCHRIYGARSE